ncbi:MAG: hypothetical protein K6C94_00050 [Candidatus Gastranaerophilales bacterium]|nr:hypothetical protein [Candidatus Gastranaerophilales bacterium]
MTNFFEYFIIKLGKAYDFIFSMIKGDYQTDDVRAALQRLLPEESVSAIGEAGLLDSDALNSLGMVAMTARSEIPQSHRNIANTYMLKKQVYGAPVIRGQITREERALLRKYDFNRLEFSTVIQISEEIAFLQQAAISLNKTQRMDAEKILQIRAKELSFLSASKYANVSNEMLTGYKAIEKYFELISSYSRPSTPLKKF